VVEGRRAQYKRRAEAEAEAAEAEVDAKADAKAKADQSANARPNGKTKKRRKLAEAKAEAEAAEKAPAAPATTPAPADEAAPDRTIFVDGVPYQWNIEKIEEFFSSCGKVTGVKAPTWQDSGRLRGFAHVTFSSPAEQKKGLALDGTKVGAKGRYLKIEAAKAVDQGQKVPSAKELEGYRRLFVKNLPYDVLEAEIIDLFKQFGKVEDVRVATSFGRCKGFAYVDFAKSASLVKAVTTLPWPELKGRALKLDADTGSGPKAGFHYRTEAYGIVGTGAGRGRGGGGEGRGGGKGDGKGDGKGKDGGKGKGKDGKGGGKDSGKFGGKGRGGKLSLF